MTSSPRASQAGCVTIVILAVLLLIGARTLASWVIDYQWWRELGQVTTWFGMIAYGIFPGIGVALLAFVVFWIAHARGMKFAGTSLRAHPVYARLATAGLFLVGVIFAAIVVDSWAVVRFFGGQGVSPGWVDPAFGKPLSFYLFDLPFYSIVLRAVLGLCLVSALIYYLTARGWGIEKTFTGQSEFRIDLTDLRSLAALESHFLRGLVVVFLLALAARLYLDRYDLVLAEHGFMVGVDWINEKITMPALWLSIAGSIAAAALVWLRRWKLSVALLAACFILQFAVPRLIAATYVRPNELSIQRPYIRQHIEATREAFGLNTRAVEKDFPATLDARIDVARNRPMLENVRIWDWQAFQDTVSQIQPLRPYAYSDSDVDRYTIDGQLRQVLVSPRELDLNQLGDAANLWTNPRLVYTHGYGLVMAEANRITSNGLPVLFIESAPPEIHSPSLKLTRPELYYGELTHEPVFVQTQQEEFNYPSGSENVKSQYDGEGGFPIFSLPLRLAAAVTYGDWNILLTGQLNAQSRMMIHRRVTGRLTKLAGFVGWDDDPYLVLSEDGRAYWITDGYLTSDAHPYSRALHITGIGSVNYIRNSVKAVVDAYHGTVTLYVFDPSDPLVNAYRNLFPTLFTDADKMPADLRAHVRYPETIFRVQAEMYRLYHMRDPDSFYNKADQWDIARGMKSQDGTPGPVLPTYIIARLPDEPNPEFLLIIPFTPRNKDNLIGFMAARCDGPNLGELVFLLLSKQELLLGPMQVEARINQDQIISKDLNLWNQQGSQVLRGQMLVIPLEDTFIYVQPIYIQAREARMPQLRKIVLAAGNELIYTDTYEQAIAHLAGSARGIAPPPDVEAAGTVVTSAPTTPPTAPRSDARVESIRNHMRRYKEMAAEGRWSEAGKELEAIEALLRK